MMTKHFNVPKVLLILLFPLSVFAQPANNDCGNATLVDVNSDLCNLNTLTPFTFADATLSGVELPPCFSGQGEADFDIWFRAVVPNGSIAAVIYTDDGRPTNASIAIYSVSCGSLTSPVGCTAGGGNEIQPHLIVDQQFAPDDEVLIRVLSRSQNDELENWQLAVYDPESNGAAPSNNVCETSSSLTVTASGAPTAPISACLVDANNSAAGVACNQDVSKDVWYSLVVPASGLLSINIDNSGSFLPGDRAPGIEVYRGACDNLELIQCSVFCDGFTDSNENLSVFALGELDNLVPGETILVRAFTLDEFDESFTIWAVDPSDDAAVSNDLCDQAIELTTDELFCEANPEIFPFRPSTYSGGVENRICASDDIWFRITMPASDSLCIYLNELDLVSSNPFGANLEFTVYQGADCDNLTLVENTGPDIFFGLFDFISLGASNGLTAGQTVWIRVTSFNEEIQSIIVQAFDPLNPNISPPANNDCTNAQTIEVNGIGTPYSITSACFEGATASGLLPEPTCITFPGPDLWYEVVVPASGYLQLFTTDITNPGPGGSGNLNSYSFEVYRGSCAGGLTSIECSASNPFFDESSQVINLGENDVSPGETLLVRVWRRIPRKNFGFDLVAFDPFSNPPVNDLCENATELTVNNDPCNLTFTQGTVEGALDSGPPSLACEDVDAPDVWFRVTVPDSDSLGIVTNFVPGSALDRLPIEAYVGTCGSQTLTPIACASEEIEDVSDGFYGSLLLGPSLGISAGQTVWIRAFAEDTDGFGRFDIAAFDANVATNNDLCTDATEIQVSTDCGNISPTRICKIGDSFTDFGEIDCEEYNDRREDGNVSDTWYQVSVPESGEFVLEIQGFISQNLDLYPTIYRGTCGNLDLVSCESFSTGGTEDNFYKYTEVFTSQDVSPGEDLYIQLLWVGDGDEDIMPVENIISFGLEIFAYQANGAPANDECTGAIELPVLTTNECVPLSFCNLNATDSQVDIPSCVENDYAGSDVWFKVTVPPNGIVAVSNYLPRYENGMAIYTSDCGNLTELTCVNDDEEDIGVAGRTPGEELLVRFYPSRENVDLGLFEICAFTAPSPMECGALEYRETMTKRGDEIGFGGATTDFSFTVPVFPTEGEPIQGTLYISGRLDVDELEEYAIITEEGGTILGNFSSLADEDCSYTILDFELTGEQIAEWGADGTIDFRATTAIRTRATDCNPDEELSISLIFCYDLDAEEIPVFTPGRLLWMISLILMVSIGLFFSLKREL